MTLGPLFRRASLLLLTPLLIQACGSDTTTPPDDDDGTIAIALNAATGTIAQGGTLTVPATLTRGGDFTGAVTFSVVGAPTGVTAGISNEVTTGTTTTAQVTVVVAADAPAGTYNMTVRATGTGVTAATAPFALTITATTTPNYSISLAPASGSAVQGGSVATTATLTRTGAFAGSVNLSLTNAPAGVTATFDPNNTVGTTSAILINVGAAVAPGVYTVFVGGVATGQVDKVTPFVLTVTAAGSYTLGVPSTATVVQGNPVTAAITLTRTGGFSGSVALTATGLPANGLTAAFSPTPTTGTTSTLTLTAAANLAAGNYPIVVHSTSAGTTEQLATITLTVTASGGGGGNGNVSMSFATCAVADKPLWFAAQNGSGAWTVVTPANDVYSFTVNAGKGGVAYVKQGTGDNYTTTVQYYTQAEMVGVALNGCGIAASGKTYTGTGANVALLDGATLSIGGSTASPSFSVPAFTLSNVASGNQDLIGWRRNFLSPGTTDRGFLRRDVNLASGASLGTIDFNGAESYTPIQAALTVPNGTLATHTMMYGTGASCTVAALYSAISPNAATMLGFPSAQQRATDYYIVNAIESNGGGTVGRTATESFHTFGAKSVSLGSAFATPTVTSLGGAYKRLQSVFTIPADYHASAVFQYVGNTPARAAVISSSYGAIGAASGTLAMPDFTGLAGWNNTWVPGTGQTVTSTTTVAGSTVTSSLCQEGVRITAAFVGGTN